MSDPFFLQVAAALAVLVALVMSGVAVWALWVCLERIGQYEDAWEAWTEERRRLRQRVVTLERIGAVRDQAIVDLFDETGRPRLPRSS